jgi:hypothetical protein
MNKINPQFSCLTCLARWSSLPRWIYRGCVAVLLPLLPGCQLADMAQFTYANAIATHQWKSEVQSTTVQFELVDGHIILPVIVNSGEPLRFVLDSGAGATVLLESPGTGSLSLNLGAEVAVSGVGNGPDPVAHIVADTDLSIGNVLVEDLAVIYLPLDSVPFFENVDEIYFDGVIGASIFDRFTIHIDYDQQLIEFSEPDPARTMTRLDDDDWREIPVEIQSGVPYMHTQIQLEAGPLVEVKLLVDTGFRGPVSLTPETHVDIDEPHDYFLTKGRGLSGDVEIKMGRSDSFSLAGIQLNNVPVSYSISGGESDKGSNGLLGSEVLSRFHVVFDYANSRMFVKPNTQHSVPINVDRSGVALRPHRFGAVVRSIADDSAAVALELQVGDIVTSINDVSVNHVTLSPLKRLLASEEEMVSICWNREDQARCENLVLENRIIAH